MLSTMLLTEILGYPALGLNATWGIFVCRVQPCYRSPVVQEHTKIRVSVEKEGTTEKLFLSAAISLIIFADKNKTYFEVYLRLKLKYLTTTDITR